MSNFFGGGAIGLYLFLYVLPGILGALVYEYVVEGEQRDTLDRVATALVLALVSAILSWFLFGLALIPELDIKSETSPGDILRVFLQPRHLALTTMISGVVALGFAAAQNHGWIYAALRAVKLTKKSSHNDVWQQAFYMYGDRWTSIEFKDGRKLVGWPLRFSPSGQPRALLLGDATWYSLNAEGAYVTRKVEGAGVYIASFDDVVSLEFLN